MVRDVGFRAEGFYDFEVWGVFRVLGFQDSGFRVQGSGLGFFRFRGSPFPVSGFRRFRV